MALWGHQAEREVTAHARVEFAAVPTQVVVKGHPPRVATTERAGLLSRLVAISFWGAGLSLVDRMRIPTQRRGFSCGDPVLVT
jgi:hypothetical protein